MKVLSIATLLLSSSLSYAQVDTSVLRPEPRKPILSSGENFIYKEVTRIPLEEHSIGTEVFQLSELVGQTVTLTTVQAPMRQVIERSVGPICVSVVVTNPNTGKPVGDADKCKNVEFDKFIPSETFSKNVTLNKSSKQDPSIPFTGSVRVNLGADKRLAYIVSGVPSNLFVLGTETRGGDVTLQIAQPADELKSAATLVKAVSVSKGILKIETNAAKVDGYRFSYKVVLNPKFGFSKEIAFLGVDLDGKYAKVETKNGVTTVNVDIRNQLADSGVSYENKKRYDFEILFSAKKLIKGEVETSILKYAEGYTQIQTYSTSITKVTAD